MAGVQLKLWSCFEGLHTKHATNTVMQGSSLACRILEVNYGTMASIPHSHLAKLP